MAESDPIEALICDCDGVIVDSEIVAERALARALGELAPAAEVVTLLRETFGQSTAAVLALMEQRLSISLSESYKSELYTHIEGLIATTAEPIAGVREALEGIDLPLAVVSNSLRASVSNSVRRAGLERRVGGRIFTAEMVARAKPAPDVYLLAVTSLGVRAAGCLAIEDSSAGVQAAVAAGVAVIGFVGASHIPPSHAQRLRALGAVQILERMTDLPATVRALREARASP